MATSAREKPIERLWATDFMSGQGYPEGRKGYRLDQIMPVGIRILAQLAFMNLSRWNFPEIYDTLLDWEASDRSLVNLFLSWKRLMGQCHMTDTHVSIQRFVAYLLSGVPLAPEEHAHLIRCYEWTDAVVQAASEELKRRRESKD